MDRRPPRVKGGKGFRPRRPALDFDDVVYGIHAIEEALTAQEGLRAIHVASDRKKDAVLRGLLGRAKELGIPVRFEDRGFFAQLPFKAHQGVVAIAPPFEYRSLHDVLGVKREGSPRLFVVLDHLTDPHNVGAIVRTAEAAGADALVLPERRSAGINATVRKAAAGAAAHLPIARVSNVADTLRTMKKAGMWIAGADADPSATEMTKTDLRGDLALAIGEEGGGLSQLVKRECDYLVRIPMHGNVASLNASVAAAILMYEVVRQREM
ncbi:MAG: 23S rRNA (guanosine(2251)-2'-O)-methyltransferase RlmB [Candidatus Eremiobacteraeota bacterium]|nr:23S rRNA (guanosine(2251)-2'-O)-methyltransferase RlmB [Candidatus Eremiobacteraeota bacterium]MBV8433291.1 23S rRNA (guanosine(2251)-2'-O)-methyltransferase RlmB [Candidatus Eremiobacteraeota bacterium]